MLLIEILESESFKNIKMFSSSSQLQIYMPSNIDELKQLSNGTVWFTSKLTDKLHDSENEYNRKRMLEHPGQTYVLFYHRAGKITKFQLNVEAGIFINGANKPIVKIHDSYAGSVNLLSRLPEYKKFVEYLIKNITI